MAEACLAHSMSNVMGRPKTNPGDRVFFLSFVWSFVDVEGDSCSSVGAEHTLVGIIVLVTKTLIGMPSFSYDSSLSVLVLVSMVRLILLMVAWFCVAGFGVV